ncbi:MAG: hypothetical protein ACLTMP_08465 [Eggerthella lenta]
MRAERRRRRTEAAAAANDWQALSRFEDKIVEPSTRSWCGAASACSPLPAAEEARGSPEKAAIARRPRQPVAQRRLQRPAARSTRTRYATTSRYADGYEPAPVPHLGAERGEAID